MPTIESVSLEAFLIEMAGQELAPGRQAAAILFWHESRMRGASLTAGELAAIMREHGLGNRKPKVLAQQLKALKVTMATPNKAIRLLTAKISEVAAWTGYEFARSASTGASTTRGKDRGRTTRSDAPTRTGKSKAGGGEAPKPRLFIGSSVEGLEIAHAIESNLQHDCDGVVWTSGVFGPNRAPLESLLRECELADFAVVVLTPDDVVVKRDAEVAVARDNCIFELGLFMGKLGRDRAFYAHERNIKLGLPSDLDGLVTLKYAARSDENWDAALSPASTLIRKAVKKLGFRSP